MIQSPPVIAMFMLKKLDQENKHYTYLNWLLLSTFFILVIIGFLVQYSVGGGNFYPFLFHQTATFFFSSVILLILFLLQNETIMKNSYYAYGLSLLLLIFASFFGKKVMGATRWISIFGVTLQPSESIKITMILALAFMFQNLSESKSSTVWKAVLYVLSITALPIILVLKQPNLGTAIIIAFIVLVVLFSVGLQMRYFLCLGLCLVASLPIIWQFLYDYQKNRILTFLGMNEDPLGKGYNILQSKIAIGSGGLLGKGLLDGTQTQLKFLPEKHSDFVFTVFAEEVGFLGGLIIIATYFIFCLEALFIGIRSYTLFNRITAISISAMFFCHYFINIGMVMGMLPIVGIPLPFISYGGSIMLTSVIAVGLLLNIHKNNEIYLVTTNVGRVPITKN